MRDDASYRPVSAAGGATWQLIDDDKSAGVVVNIGSFNPPPSSSSNRSSTTQRIIMHADRVADGCAAWRLDASEFESVRVRRRCNTLQGGPKRKHLPNNQ